MNEIWKDINGYEGLYQISSFGNVKRLNRITDDGRHLKEKLLKLNICGDGYIEVGLTKNHIRKFYYVHRLVAEHFIKNTDKIKTDVDHIDTIRTNNNVNNLRWVTKSENNLNILTKKRLGHRKGIHLSNEHKRKISEAMKRKK